MAALCAWRPIDAAPSQGWENRHGIVDAPMPDDGPEFFHRHSHRHRQPKTGPGHADHRSVSLLRLVELLDRLDGRVLARETAMAKLYAEVDEAVATIVRDAKSKVA
jgi:hypothetical protein